MFDFHEKRKIKGLVYSKVSILILLVLAVWLSFSVYERFTVEREMAAKRDAKLEELEILKQRAAALESQVHHLDNERGIEEELRNRFDVAKEGEQVVVIIDEGSDGTDDLEALSQPPGTAETEEESSFLSIFKFW